MKTFNRRDFIKGVAVMSTAAVCVAATGKNAFAEEKTEAPAAPDIKAGEPPRLPWGGYKELDPEYVRKLGHLGYYLNECAGGAFWAIMTAMKESVGYPYIMIPLPTKDEYIAVLSGEKKEIQVPMQYGVGGIANFGSVCGAPNGAASAMTYILPMEGVLEIVPRLMRYYEVESFPTEKSNEYATGHQFLTPKMKSDKALLRSPSHSVLCHVSVGKWCEASGYASGSKERSERCGRITGDIAAMAVTMINAYVKGDLNSVFPMKHTQETTECLTCHTKGEKFEKGEFTRGAMDCAPCHDEAMEPHRGPNKLKTVYGANVGTLTGAAVVGTIAGIGAHAVNKRFTKGNKDEE